MIGPCLPTACQSNSYKRSVTARSYDPHRSCRGSQMDRVESRVPLNWYASPQAAEGWQNSTQSAGLEAVKTSTSWETTIADINNALGSWPISIVCDPDLSGAETPNKTAAAMPWVL